MQMNDDGIKTDFITNTLLTLLNLLTGKLTRTQEHTRGIIYTFPHKCSGKWLKNQFSLITAEMRLLTSVKFIETFKSAVFVSICLDKTSNLFCILLFRQKKYSRQNAWQLKKKKKVLLIVFCVTVVPIALRSSCNSFQVFSSLLISFAAFACRT